MIVRLSAMIAVSMLIIGYLSTPVAWGRDSDAMEFTKDSLEAVQKNVADGKAVLVDVRSIIEWNDGHVTDAIFLPFRDLQSKGGEKLILDSLPKDKIIYTYCAVGYRSSRAGKMIAQLKFDVRPLKPGFEELAKAGFETEKGDKK